MDTARRTQTYGHYCLMAQTLDVLGDRWTLLVVRDLVHGPRRFTDLADTLGGITPKTLTQRLRALEHEGIVAADREAGRREVRYRLTPAGQELVPVLEQLARWGLRNALRPPEPGEPTHPEHLLWALRLKLEDAGAALDPVRWLVRVAGESHVLGFDGERWTLTRGETSEPDVTVTATRTALAKFLTGPPSAREAEQPELTVTGGREAVRTMLDTIAVFPFGPGRAHRGSNVGA
ncbi:winged helix-turn-helix transcriptional regulator [Amycolatopsis sp. NPDC051903]|uniref:winged helix-turn-helix transcriptional regulator n=1 Tax=Amycolatopsis sp. NPDC051903 TaxID=3363936 RepID=UPI0037A34EAF